MIQLHWCGEKQRREIVTKKKEKEKKRMVAQDNIALCLEAFIAVFRSLLCSFVFFFFLFRST